MSLRQLSFWGLTLYISFVFLQSLFFKFTYSPETNYIFSTLDMWAEETFGIEGIFSPGGIFSAYVIGSFELISSVLLLFGMVLRKDVVHALGALVGLGIISGAIFFHLFTPLGTVIISEDMGVESDGGLLFMMASGVWISCLMILWLRRRAILGLLSSR